MKNYTDDEIEMLFRSRIQAYFKAEEMVVKLSPTQSFAKFLIGCFLIEIRRKPEGCRGTVHAAGMVYLTPNEQGIGLDECCELVAQFLIEQSQAIQQGAVVANALNENNLFKALIDAARSILDNCTKPGWYALEPFEQTDYTVPPCYMERLADAVGKIEETDTGAQDANYKPETSLSIKEILAQMRILDEQLSEQIKLAVSDTILAEVQKQQRPGGNLAKTTPPTDTQTE